jgi:hypothetical protein
MAERRRNPYRPGTPSYAQLHAGALKRKAALGRLNAAGAKTPETRRRARQRASAALRALLAIEVREDYRSKLNAQDRATFDRLTIRQQQQLMAVQREYPGSVPKDLPDSFVGPKREELWQLSYSTRSGIRPRPSV